MKPKDLSASQKAALLFAKRRRPIYRTSHGPWKGQGGPTINHPTIRNLVARGLLEERNRPSLHVIATPAGEELAAEIERGKRNG